MQGARGEGDDERPTTQLPQVVMSQHHIHQQFQKTKRRVAVADCLDLAGWHPSKRTTPTKPTSLNAHARWARPTHTDRLDRSICQANTVCQVSTGRPRQHKTDAQRIVVASTRPGGKRQIPILPGAPPSISINIRAAVSARPTDTARCVPSDVVRGCPMQKTLCFAYTTNQQSTTTSRRLVIGAFSRSS